jgi:O-antigen ligase
MANSYSLFSTTTQTALSTIKKGKASMKLNSSSKWDSVEIFGYVLLFYALPVSIRISALASWFLLAIWLLKPDLKARLKCSLKTKYVWILSMPLFYMMATLISSDEPGLGAKSIENKMFFLLFPLLFSSTTFTKYKFNLILKTFTSSIVFWSLVCLGIGLYNVATQNVSFKDMSGDVYNRVVSQWGYISGSKLLEPISLSPIYMSLFVGFAVLICLHLYNVIEFKRRRAGIAALIVYFLVFNLLLGARMGIISLLLILAIHFLKSQIGQSKNSRRSVSIIGSLAAATVVLLITINPLLQKRFFSDLISLSIPQEPSGWNSVNIRMAIWNCSLELFKKKPFLGYGAGSPDKYREECYKQYSFYPAFGTDLNSHNQYLEYLLIGGLPLLLILLFTLAASYRQAMIFNSALFKNFIIFVVLNLLTESFLNVQKGLIFYVYFASFLLFGLRSLRSNQLTVKV